MKDPWTQFSPLWWNSRFGSSFGFPASPTQPIDKSWTDPWADPWPTIAAQTLRLPSTLPIAPTPPKGGLLSSLNADPSGGLLKSLAQPARYPNLGPVDEPWPNPWPNLWPNVATQALRPPSMLPIPPAPPQGSLFGPLNTRTSDGLLEGPAHRARYPKPASAPARTSAQPSADGIYPSSIPYAPSWSSVPLHPAERSAPVLAETQGRSSRNVSAGAADGEPRANYSGGAQGFPEVQSDVTPDNYWIPGGEYAGVGHHHVPRAVFLRTFAFPAETRKVFDKATTGQLPFYGWHQYDELHRQYSAAVEDLINRFMKEQNIKAEQMTPDHARAVLKSVAESDDPRIRIYRAMLQHMRRLYRLRGGGRGSE